MLFCTLTLAYFCVSSLFDPVPNFIKQSSGLAIITRIILEIELFTAFNSFAGAVKTQKLTLVPSIRVSGSGKLIRNL